MFGSQNFFRKISTCEGKAVFKIALELNPVRCWAFVVPIKIRSIFRVRLPFIISAFTLHWGFNHTSFVSGISHGWISPALQPVILQPGWDIQPGAGAISPVPGVIFMHPDRKPAQKSAFSFAWKPKLFQYRSPSLTQGVYIENQKNTSSL